MSGNENANNGQTGGKRPDQTSATARERQYEKIAIDGFRGFDRFELEGLSRINIFFGRNNCGKTSILEAIYAHACGHNFGPLLYQVILRRQDGAISGHYDLGEKIRSLFRSTSETPYSFSLNASLAGDPTEYKTRMTFEPSLELAGLDPLVLGQQYTTNGLARGVVPTDATETESERISFRQPGMIPTVSVGRWTIESEQRPSTVEIKYPPFAVPPAPPFKLAIMHDMLSHRAPKTETQVFSYLKRYDMLEEFIDNLTGEFSEITSIDMIPYPDGSSGPVYAITKDRRRVPLWAFGDGMRRWLYLLGHMLVFRNACHCIEEIDATFHPAAQPRFSSLLVGYARRFNNQLFLTSHSIEFTDAFLEALYGENGIVKKDEEDPVRLFSLRLEGGSTTPVVWALEGRDAFAKRRDFELELR